VSVLDEGWRSVTIVQPLTSGASGLRSFTVVDTEGLPVRPAEAFLRHLESLNYSPNTVRAYAHDLADFFRWVSAKDVDWRTASIDDIGDWVSWLRLPGPARAGVVAVLPCVEPGVSERTIDRKLGALSSFYAFHRRRDSSITLSLTRWDRPSGRGGFTPFLAHARKVEARREIKLRGVLRQAPEVVTADDFRALLDACDRLRDRFLLQLLRDSGLRIGEALGLRHSDLSVARREIAVVPRTNENGARVKRGKLRVVPVPAALFAAYADYLDGEYGDLDCDYVFVNLFAGRVGRPWTYDSAREVLIRLRGRTGMSGFTFHHLRHTYATELIRAGADWAIVAHLLGHASVQTTLGAYGHLSVDDARRALEAAGWLTPGTHLEEEP
jgi:integrase/recombinase XerD